MSGLGRRRTITALLATGAVTLAACSTAVVGTPVAHDTPIITPPTPTSTTSPGGVPTVSSQIPTIPPPARTPASGSTVSPPPPITTDSSSPATLVDPTSLMIGHHDTVSRPEVPAGGSVIVELPHLPTSYDANRDAWAGYPTEVAALTQPSPYLVDPYGAVALDTDLLDGVAIYTHPQRIVYRINPKATWSDGVPVSCQDFYLAWLANTSNATDPSNTGASAFGSLPNTLYSFVNAPQCFNGGKTVTVTFITPTPSWRGLFTGLLPAHIAATDAGIADITTIGKDAVKGRVLKLAAAYVEDFGTLAPSKAVSAGPYMVTYADGSEIVLLKNPNWWGNPAGPKSIKLKLAPLPEVALQQLRYGGADVASVTDQEPSQAEPLNQMVEFTRTNQTWPLREHLEFNLRRPLFTGKAGKALRQAMFECVDRSAILDQMARPINPDAQQAGNLMVAPWDPAYTDHYGPYTGANVATAKRILQQGGWTLGDDGVFAHGATKARFTLGVLPKATRYTIGDIITRSCQKAGIEISMVDVDVDDLYDGKFQAALFAWAPATNAADYAYTYSSDAVQNTSGYSNPRVDALFDSIYANLQPGDETGRLNQIDQFIADDQVVLPLYNWSAVNLQSGRVQTTVTNNYFWGGPVWDAYAWHVAN